MLSINAFTRIMLLFLRIENTVNYQSINIYRNIEHNIDVLQCHN